MEPTTQTESLVQLARDVFGPDLVGAYLHGSSVLGGLRPRSDLDVLVVSRRHATREDRRALVRGLLRISGVYPRRGPDLPIELTVVAQSEVLPWRYPPRREFQYGEWLRGELERGADLPPKGDSDLALLITMVLRGDAPLFGPPPAAVLDQVPFEDVRRASAAAAREVVADLEWDTRNVILTLARIWATLATGTILSKDAAADWALDSLPAEHRPVLARARTVYLGEAEERWDDLQPWVRPHVDHVAAEIDRLAPREREGVPSGGPIPVLVITGPVGVGKSTVSQAVSDLLAEAGIAHGVVELDCLRHCHPSPPGDRFHVALGYRNLAALAANYRAAGAARLVLVDIVETRAQTEDYRRAIPGAQVEIVGLRGSLPTIHSRLAARETGANLAWHRRRASELIEQWRASPVEDFLVDTEGKNPAEVAREVLARCGWDRL